MLGDSQEWYKWKKLHVLQFQKIYITLEYMELANLPMGLPYPVVYPHRVPINHVFLNLINCKLENKDEVFDRYDNFQNMVLIL